MADEVATNGGDQTLEITENEDLKVSKLMVKFEKLELENGELVSENFEVKERVSKLEGEIEALESEKAELSREVARLDADKKSLETEGVKANREVVELKREVEKLKESGVEIKESYELLEKERDSLLKQLGEAEEKLRGAVGEETVKELKKKLEEAELVVAGIGEEMGKLKKEKDGLEGAKSRLEQLVKESEEKSAQLVKDLEASELVISALKEKTLNGINGIHVIEDGEKGGMYGPKLQWPVLAVSTGLVVTIGSLWYLRARQR